jgi:inhibitor of KinA sporulation pathway (predicted exonuclease)
MNFILDTEYLTWNYKSNINDKLRKKWQKKEIIQIGICQVIEKKNKLIIKKKLKIYVKPKYNPIIPKRIVKLTRITQNIIDNKGISFSEASKKLNRFIGVSAKVISMGDEKELFIYNCKINNIKVLSKIKKAKFIDLQKILKKKYKKKNYFTADLPKIFNFKQDKKPHNAINDCYTIVKCLNNSLKKINYTIF